MSRSDSPPDVSALPSLLVIDDIPAVGAAIRIMVRGKFQVELATGLREALALLDHPARFVAILCDIQLASARAQELTDHLQSRHPELAEKVVLMTGGSFPEGAEAIPASRRLLKPFTTEQLLGALAQVGAMVPTR